MDDLVKIHDEANKKIAIMYGSNIPANCGQVTISIGKTYYIVYFSKIEDGWVITGHTKI